MAKDIQRKSGEAYSRSPRRDSLSGKFSGIETRNTAGSALTQRVTKALKSANTVTQTFKPKNAR